MQVCEINLEDQEEKYESEVTLLSIIATFHEFYRLMYEWKWVLPLDKW